MKSIDFYKAELHQLTSTFDFNSNNPYFEVHSYIKWLGNYIGNKYLKGHLVTLNTDKLFLTRARKNVSSTTLYSSLNELWYPQKDYIIAYGRANFKRQQMFYCSDVPGTALFEVKPTSEGELITSIELSISKKNLRLYSFGISEKYPIKFQADFSNKETAINEFMADKFKEEVPKNLSYLYLPTAIITNLFVKDFDGIIFPSVASKLKGENIALRPCIIDNFHTIKEARVFEIIDFKSSADFRVKCKYVSREIKENGDIAWESTKCDGHHISGDIYHKHK